MKMELQDPWILAQDSSSETSVSGNVSSVKGKDLSWMSCCVLRRVYRLSVLGVSCSPVPCVLFNCSVMSDSLHSHALQHARLPCPSLSPRVCSDSVHWFGDAIQPSVTHYSSCPQSFPASGSFPMNWLFTLVGQSIGALAPVLTMNIQGWLCLGLTGLIFLLSKVLSRVFSSTTV